MTTKNTNSSKKIQPFAIYTADTNEETVRMIIDKMIEAGVRECETLDSYHWNICDCWGYSPNRGTFTEDKTKLELYFNNNLLP